MKIYIGIIFLSAFALTLHLISDMIKNVVALLRASRAEDYIFQEALKGVLIQQWKIYLVGLFWAAFIVLNLYV